MRRSPTPAAQPPIPQLPMRQSMPALPTHTLSQLVCRINARIQLHTTPQHAAPKYASPPSACYTSVGNHALPPDFRSSHAHTRRTIHPSTERPLLAHTHQYPNCPCTSQSPPCPRIRHQNLFAGPMLASNYIPTPDTPLPNMHVFAAPSTQVLAITRFLLFSNHPTHTNTHTDVAG